MSKKFTPYIYILFFALGFHNLNAQELELKIVLKDSTNNSFLNFIDFKKYHENENSINKEIDSISYRFQKLGFINNHIDSIQIKDTISTAYFDLEENSKTIKISFPENPSIENIARDFTNDYSNNYFIINLNQVSEFLNKIVSYYENSGKSFTEISLKNIQTHNNEFIADLHINSSAKRSIDKIIVTGYSKFPKSFINHQLNLKIGSNFNSDKLKKSSEALQSITFASEIKDPEILFTNDSTIVYLHLQKIKSNIFDGLIGFSTNDDSKLEFNGYLDLLLNNILNKGEVFSLKWQSNAEERKSFDLSLETPYIFNSPISPKATFNIYKQDSSYLNTKTDIDISYAINQYNKVSARFQSENSNDLESENPINAVEGYKNKFYGLSYINLKPHSLNSFQHKFYFNLNALWGNRTLTEGNSKTSQQKYELHTYYNWKLNRQNSIFIQNQSGLLISEDYYLNELFRIGGANSIRGFNEESIFVSSFSVFNLEYRFLIAEKSYLHSISDFAYTQNNINNIESQLYSFGLGYVYGTKNGQINVSYAIGKQSNLPFDFQNSKFHVRLLQYF